VSPTASPTTGLGPSGGDVLTSNIAIIGGGVALGAVAILGMAFAEYRRRKRHLTALAKGVGNWTHAEIWRFRLVFRDNHDFDALCEAFPNKSRESIAILAKSILAENTVYRGKSSYAFLRSRANKVDGAMRNTYATPTPQLVKLRTNDSHFSSGSNLEQHDNLGTFTTNSSGASTSLTPYSSKPHQPSLGFRERRKMNQMAIAASVCQPPGLSLKATNPQFVQSDPSLIPNATTKTTMSY
jgi:hypothetical protein